MHIAYQRRPTAQDPHDSGIRLAELMASFSTATDLAAGQPMEHALQAAILGVRLADAAGLSASQAREAYYCALLANLGVNAEAHWLCGLVGDEQAFHKDWARLDSGDDGALLALGMRYIRQANVGANPLRMARLLMGGLAQFTQLGKTYLPAQIDIARRLATRMGFEQSLVDALGQLRARWDGKGVPAIAGEAIALPAQVAQLCHDAATFFRIDGIDGATTMVRQRAGGAYAPALAETFCKHAERLFDEVDDNGLRWELVLDAEPLSQSYLTEGELDTICEAIADFADMKSPTHLAHSRRVAALAAEAARLCHLAEPDVAAVRRAGWLHDIGRVGVGAGIWHHTGSLSESQWSQVRMHPMYTERVLVRRRGNETLSHLGALAAMHHERLDGSGYYRGLKSNALPTEVRILSAADVYCGLTEPRPHRIPYSAQMANAHLLREQQSGRLDRIAVEVVHAAAQLLATPSRKRGEPRPGHLSARETQVLRLAARGLSPKLVARELNQSTKSVETVLEHAYEKMGVSNRAAAALFIVEHGLLF
jgi:HD-GYP domain-containing protein (c-di-GMP phosphodiesterase class II)